jgi:hypothetical protein
LFIGLIPMAIVYHHTHIDKLAKERGGEESNALLTLSTLIIL